MYARVRSGCEGDSGSAEAREEAPPTRAGGQDGDDHGTSSGKLGYSHENIMAEAAPMTPKKGP